MKYDAAVIGAGVSGAAVAGKLSQYELNTVLIDKEADVSSATDWLGAPHPPILLKPNLVVSSPASGGPPPIRK
ncbi:MAG: NAD(P)-binding protein [Spirochaetales bacterium]|uniref:NAD(P)-binding protein n=1 Tax=Candidatus Thalassospirochaeta sargassi TaxID=3119039 RepID=A0AAJ1MMS5_9SPIO|nr:NAD(P)-binding protein [Spirochaetales bacterium]